MASPFATRTFLIPPRSASASRFPWPGVCTSAARIPVAGSAAAICAVASPIPKPISSTTGSPSNSFSRSMTECPSMSSPQVPQSRFRASPCPVVTRLRRGWKLRIRRSWCEPAGSGAGPSGKRGSVRHFGGT